MGNPDKYMAPVPENSTTRIWNALSYWQVWLAAAGLCMIKLFGYLPSSEPWGILKFSMRSIGICLFAAVVFDLLRRIKGNGRVFFGIAAGAFILSSLLNIIRSILSQKIGVDFYRGSAFSITNIVQSLFGLAMLVGFIGLLFSVKNKLIRIGSIAVVLPWVRNILTSILISHNIYTQDPAVDLAINIAFSIIAIIGWALIVAGCYESETKPPVVEP